MPIAHCLLARYGLEDAQANSRFIDPTADEELMNKTLAQLGETGPFKNLTLGQGLTSDDPGLVVGARTIFETKTIYFNGTGGTADEFGRTVFHELLHIIFKGNHVSIAKGLGLNYQTEKITETERKKAEEEVKFGNKNYIPKTIVSDDDDVATRSLREFLESGCKKK